MRNIMLLSMAVIDGAARYPIEGPIVVSDEKAEELIEAELAQSAEVEDHDEAEKDDLDAMTVEELKEVAVAEEVDIGRSSTSAGIAAKIREHRKAAAAQ